MSWSALEEIESFVDPLVREEVLAFHAHTNWVVGADGVLPRPWTICLSNIPQKVVDATGGLDHPLGLLEESAIPLSPSCRQLPLRVPSAKAFCPRATVNGKDVSELLAASFAQTADGHRPYPSAGALYPVGIAFIGFDRRIDDPNLAGAFHYRPARHVLEPLPHLEQSLVRRALFGNTQLSARHAAGALVFFFHVSVAVFKYRHRGYRHALLEIGAMGQQVDLVAKELGLATRIWSGFSDFELSRALGLNPTVAPIVITQLIGIESSDVRG